MKEKILKFKDGLPDLLRKAFNSYYFPFVCAAVTMVCYYLGWDLVTIYYMGICSILILFLCDDLTPLIAVFLFMNVMISKQNSPSFTVGGADYYFRTAVYSQIIVIIVLYVCAILYRIYKTVQNDKFKITPAFFGLLALAAAMLLNGIFSEDYDPMNLAYGLFMAFFFLGIFMLLKDNISPTEKTFKKIAISFIALSVLLMVELIVTYATTEKLIENGTFYRWYLMFGWGTYNTMGMLLVISIPSAFYLAGKVKYGYLFLIYAIPLAICAYLSASRQAMIAATVMLPVCAIYLLVKGKNKLANGIICGAALVLFAIFVGVFRDKIYSFVTKIFENTFVDGTPDGSGRWTIWKRALQNFAAAPIFGTGFYVEIPEAAEMVGLSIIPLMYHNTFMQLLGSCGILGFAAYALHRTQTVVSYFKKPGYDRTFIVFTVAALLIMNLFDNHLFYILPTLIYSSLIALLIKSEAAA